MLYYFISEILNNSFLSDQDKYICLKQTVINYYTQYMYSFRPINNTLTLSENIFEYVKMYDVRAMMCTGMSYLNFNDEIAFHMFLNATKLIDIVDHEVTNDTIKDITDYFDSNILVVICYLYSIGVKQDVHKARKMLETINYELSDLNFKISIFL
jgi:hypothetical protein